MTKNESKWMNFTYEDYSKVKKAFFDKYSKYDWRVETSGLDEYGRYHKEYIFENGKIWYEVMTPVTRTAVGYLKVEHTEITIKVEQEVKLLQTEYWNSDNADSYYYYERY